MSTWYIPVFSWALAVCICIVVLMIYNRRYHSEEKIVFTPRSLLEHDLKVANDAVLQYYQTRENNVAEHRKLLIEKEQQYLGGATTD